MIKPNRFYPKILVKGIILLEMTASYLRLYWVKHYENEDDMRVEVHFDDDSEEIFEKVLRLRQIWLEDAG